MIYTWNAVLGYTSDQMMSLILDVECYPQFIPFCTNVRVIERSHTFLKAELSTSQGWSYTSQVNWTEKDICIKHPDFCAQWEVHHFVQGCRVNFRIDLACCPFFKRPLLKSIISFVAPQIIKAFTQRAITLYGSSCGEV